MQKNYKPVKHKKADVFRSFILERHVIWNHNGSVKRQTKNNPIPVGINKNKSCTQNVNVCVCVDRAKVN